MIFVTFAVGVLVYYFAEVYFRSRRRQRDALFVIILGLVLGLVPMLLSNFDVLLLPTYDHTAFAGTTNALGFGYAVVRFGTTHVSSVTRRETLDTLVDPYLAVDNRYRLVDFNTPSQQVFDAISESTLGSPLQDIAPQLADELMTAEGLADPSDLFSQSQEDRTSYYRVRVSPVSGWGSTRGYAIVLTDVTALEESRQVIRKQNQRLDAFAGTVSHDLRNPLQVATGRLKLAKEECESEHLDAIEQSLQRMGDLIETLLTVAREDDAITDWEWVTLADMTTECWQTVETGSAKLETDIDRVIRADRSRLRQLIENLIRNAVEHGGEEMTITVGELDDGFYIEDDGPGIPEDERDHVFETGYSTSTDGTGLGLSIVKEVAEAHGWEVRVTDGSEGGARFEITGVECSDESTPASE